MIIRIYLDRLKNMSLYKMNYYPEPGSYSRSKIKVRLVHLCNKIWFKRGNSIDTSKFVKKADLASLKSKEDKIDLDKL